MYDDTLSVNNKIITEKDLFDIFSSMSTELEKTTKKAMEEKQRNQMFDYNYQTWTLKDFSGSLTFQVEFTDNTSIKFDKYATFMTAFNQRLREIKYIYVSYTMSYGIKNPETEYDYIAQHIYLHIREYKMEIDTSLSSKDELMNDVYNLIKEKILNAKEKYDEIIRKKNSIISLISFTNGLIPAMIIASLTLLIPQVREILSNYFFIYPIAVLLLSYPLGGIFSSKVYTLYDYILPSKDDYNNNNLDSYLNSSEILIGKNINNLINREEIGKLEKKSRKKVLILLSVLVILTILLLIFL